jgi:hypothetical protein
MFGVSARSFSQALTSQIAKYARHSLHVTHLGLVGCTNCLG